jgi:hypothetical protein
MLYVMRVDISQALHLLLKQLLHKQVMKGMHAFVRYALYVTSQLTLGAGAASSSQAAPAQGVETR